MLNTEFSKCFSVIWDSYVEKSLFRSISYFSIGLYGLLMSTFLRMYFKYQTSVTSYVGEHIFPSCRPWFVLLIVSGLCLTELSQDHEVKFIDYASYSLCFGVLFRMLSPVPMSSKPFPTFSFLAQDIWFHIEVLIILVFSIANGYQNESICILWNADLIRQEQLAVESFFH